MADAHIKISGLGPLQAKLNKLKDFSFVKHAVQTQADRVMGLMKVYPPQPPQSTYRRTDQLKHGWNVKSENSGLRAIIGNAVEYGPYVQDEEMQAWMHQGRWQTDSQIAEQERDEVIRAIKQAIDAALAG